MKKQILYTFTEYKAMSKQCGYYATAKHMQKAGYTVETALYVLLGKMV